METIVTILVFLAISGLSTYLRKKSQAKESRGMPAPPPPNRSPGGGAGSPQPEGQRSLTSSWEEELRRLLKGETPAEPGGTPPPIRPRPLSRENAPPVLVPEPKAEPIFEAEPIIISADRSETVGAAFAKFQDADSAIANARSLRDKAALDLASAKEMSARKGYRLEPKRTVSRSGEIAQTMAMFRSPGSARRAIIASVVLGPPRGLQAQDPSLF